MEKVLKKISNLIEFLIILIICFIGLRKGGYYKLDTLGPMYILNLFMLLFLLLKREIKINKKVIFYFIFFILSYFLPILLSNYASLSGALNFATRMYSIYMVYIVITNSDNKEKYMQAILIFVAFAGLLLIDEAGYRIFNNFLIFVGGGYASEIGEEPLTIFQYSNLLGLLCLLSIIFLYKLIKEKKLNNILCVILLNFYTIILIYCHSKMVVLLYVISMLILPIFSNSKKDFYYLFVNLFYSLLTASISQAYNPYIVIFFEIIALGIVLLYNKVGKKKKRIFEIFGIILLFILIVINYNNIKNTTLFRNINYYFDTFESTSLRFTYYCDGIKIFLSTPLNFFFGKGGNAFRTLYEIVQTKEYISLETHSIIIQILVESGIIGIMSFLALNIYVIKHSSNKYYKYMIILFLTFSFFDVCLTYLFIMYFWAILLAINTNDNSLEYSNKTITVLNIIMYICVFLLITLQFIAMIIEPKDVSDLNNSLELQEKIITKCKIASYLDFSDLSYLQNYNEAIVNYLDILDIKNNLYGFDDKTKRNNLVNILYSNIQKEVIYEKNNKYAIEDRVFYVYKYVDQLVEANYLEDKKAGYEKYLIEMLETLEKLKSHWLNDSAKTEYYSILNDIYYKYMNINEIIDSENLTFILGNIKEMLI